MMNDNNALRCQGRRSPAAAWRRRAWHRGAAPRWLGRDIQASIIIMIVIIINKYY